MALALVAIAAGAAHAQTWGDLTLRVVYDADKLPKPAPLAAAAAGVPFCGGLPLADDSLLIDPKDKGIANVFVYLFEADASKVPVHPSYEKTAKDEVHMANMGCAFAPKAIAMRTSQKFVGTNPDPVGHNMQFLPFDNAGFNLAIPSGGVLPKVFSMVEKTPATMKCTAHPWMQGLVLIREDPYFAVSDKSGNIKIANLPAGKWAFRVWHEKIGFVREARLGGKPVEWPRGSITWEIKAGKNDLGELLVKPEAFK
jgi:hypothetical protein